MTYEIIKNSESQTGYDIEDARYVGCIEGVYCGYQFEVIKNGKVGYFSVMYSQGTPEDCIFDNASSEEEFFGDFGCVPTGKVVFRGYYRISWSHDYDDYDFEPSYVRDVKTEEAIER